MIDTFTRYVAMDLSFVKLLIVVSYIYNLAELKIALKVYSSSLNLAL